MEKKAVNLLQQRRAPPTFWERLYDWVTNTCRIIVIVTEVLVLGAFGWRFWLDRRLNDLKGEIEKKGEALKILSSQEEEIRTLQDKLSAYEQLWDQSSNYAPVVDEVNSYIPQETEELSVSITHTDEGVRLLSVGGVLVRDKIDGVENKLKDSASFTDVVVSQMDREDESENTWEFTINAKIIFEEGRSSLTENEGTES